MDDNEGGSERALCRIGHININGLYNKLADVAAMIRNFDLDIIGISEARLLH